MSLIDILFRVDDICKKYEKYDVDKQRELNANADDAFSRLYAIIETEIESAVYKSETASVESNRARKVAMYADVRKTKAKLVEEVGKLQKLAVKKVKGISREEMIRRNDMVIMLPDRIKEIPDDNSGASAGAPTKNKWSGGSHNIAFDSPGDKQFDAGFYEETEESSGFRNEYEMRKKKQDEGLDIISEGLDTLKNMAIDMNDELDRQVPLMDEIDTKVDKATSDLKNTNVRLKQTIQQVRSNKNFCVDIILLCIILGIASYLFNTLKS